MSAARTQESATSRQADADAQLAMAASREAASRALRAGSRAPLFTLADVAGQRVSLEDLLSDGPVVLHFLRGAWCSFGGANLSGICQNVSGCGGARCERRCNRATLQVRPTDRALTYARFAGP
jgi:AhpC/TSA family